MYHFGIFKLTNLFLEKNSNKDDRSLVRTNIKLDDFSSSNQPTWEDQNSATLGALTAQDHCEYGLQFIIKNKLTKKLFCTCCFVECEDSDAQIFSFHARSLQHITRALVFISISVIHN